MGSLLPDLDRIEQECVCSLALSLVNSNM